MEVKHFIVTANNPCQEYRLHGELVKVIKSADGFFAEHYKLGHGKVGNDRLAAIRNLLREHGCFNVFIDGQAHPIE